MRLHDLHFFPQPPLYLLAFLLLLGLAVVFLRYYLIGHAYERLGLSRRAAVLILFTALLGSAVNIPVVRLPSQRVVQPRIIDFFGMQCLIPSVAERQSTMIAFNVGGAAIPVLFVIYLVARYGTSRRSLLALGVVTLVTHFLAQPVPGVGIALPPLLPSLVTAAAAILLDPWGAPRTAFIAAILCALGFLGWRVLQVRRVRRTP